MQEFLIPAPNLGALSEKIEKLDRRAQKMGLPGVSMRIVGTVCVPGAVGEVRVSYRVEVAGPEPKIAGYRLIAALDHGPHGNLVRGFTEVPAKFYTSPNGCDHCRKAIATRQYTVVLQDEAGEYIQVGLTCLKDFIGHGDPQSIAEFFTHVAELEDFQGEDEDCWSGGRYVPHWRLDWFVGLATAAIRTKGWFSSQSDEGQPTKITVMNHIDPNPFMSEASQKLATTQEDFDTGVKAVEWAKNLPADPGQQYLWNLRLLAHEGFCTSKTAGIAASLGQAFQRHLNDLAARALAARSPSNHVGVIGESWSGVVEVTFVQAVESRFGACYLNKFIDPDGNVFVWFTSKIAGPVGKKVNLVGTVKAHGEYRDQKTTTLTGGHVVEDLEAWRAAQAKKAAAAARKAERAAQKAKV